MTSVSNIAHNSELLCCGFDVSSIVETPQDGFLSEYHYDMRLFADTKLPLAHTKDISEVKATGKKPFKQKGTGGARQGSLVSAQHVGGGIAHGPRAKRSHISLNKKSTKKAKRMAFGYHLKNNSLFVCDTLIVKDHKTKSLLDVLSTFNIKNGSRCLIINDVNDINLFRSSSNLPLVSIWKPASVTVHALFKADVVIVTKLALELLKVVLSK